jgi:hypothetical protein
MIHFIPEGEENLHSQSQDCKCDPVFDLDENSGEMVWFHIPLTVDLSTPGIAGWPVRVLLLLLALMIR